MKPTQQFHPQSFEEKWQQVWKDKRIYQPDIAKAEKPFDKAQGKPFYNLMMFPYPSAEGLHVGNMYAFVGADIYGRYMRMQGRDVFEPIGLDGFGIHSENYAIKVARHPKQQAKVSEKNFYRQLASIGNGFAWENRLETYDPDYYRWTQWLFVQLFARGLAYRKKSPVNFCPSCKTVLSDEQVINGLCERCKSHVEKRDMEQWFFRITDYAEKLLQNTYRDDFHWTEKVKIGQRNWIGKKEGINIRYQVSGLRPELRPRGIRYQIECFTTRPDTNFGATFIVLGPEHPLVADILNEKINSDSIGVKVKNEKRKEIQEYIDQTKKVSDQERIAQGRKKTGVFTGFYAINQLNDYRMPVYISDFVLGHVGTGAVVGVPGHDLRDFEFAETFHIPIVRVVVGTDQDTSPISRPEQVQEEEGTMINSAFLDGKDIHEATRMIMDYLEEKGWGKRVVTYKLRDWCISRQRYWGGPIPMIYCRRCAEKNIGWLSLHSQSPKSPREKAIGDDMPGWFPVPEGDLPVLLPDLDDWKPEGTGKGPLAKVKTFVNTVCPHCGSHAQRETDVSDTFLDSSWYFLRYPFQHLRLPKSPREVPDGTSPRVLRGEKLPWDKDILKQWFPVHMYIGGAEHTVLHLLYARFITMVLFDADMVNAEEPFRRFYAHGLIIKEGAKMSKSRGNIVVPDEYIQKYGSDTLRTYLMFLGPFDAGGDFSDTGIAGMYKFLGRVWRLVYGSLSPKSPMLPRLPKEKAKIEQNSLDRIMHKTIKEVTDDMKSLRYNTAIAHIMEYVNEISNFKFQISNISMKHIETLLLLLAPFAPHMTEELYQQMRGRSGKEFSSIHRTPWPQYDPAAVIDDEVTIVVQINGKLRDSFTVRSTQSAAKVEMEKRAGESEKVKKFLEGKIVRKTIFVPGKLINFVVS